MGVRTFACRRTGRGESNPRRLTQARRIEPCGGSSYAAKLGSLSHRHCQGRRARIAACSRLHVPRVEAYPVNNDVSTEHMVDNGKKAKPQGQPHLFSKSLQQEQHYCLCPELCLRQLDRDQLQPAQPMIAPLTDALSPFIAIDYGPYARPQNPAVLGTMGVRPPSAPIQSITCKNPTICTPPKEARLCPVATQNACGNGPGSNAQGAGIAA
jgi:hypothetical protein